jgi:hypothetical protein
MTAAGAVVGWAVIAALVWAVVVIVPGELIKHRAGVVFVVDQQPVRAFGSESEKRSGWDVETSLCRTLL